ncbi:MAG: ABC transporter ATP-binding protein [Desulfobacteraceae bacterium]|nr:ABC transporter ATP-binding protein [Desulfobacteraceae bacterium]
MLKVCDLSTSYGMTQKLWDVCIEVNESEIVALIGSNGAGKTELLNAISGVLPPVSGTVEFLGQRIDGLPPHSIAELGISHVPEGGKVFPDMTVYENLEMGAYPIHAWKQKEQTLEQVYHFFPILKERVGQLARTLSGGEHQMLAIGRGLMSKPRLCLLDEPSYGLAPKLVSEIFHIIKELRDQGITVLLIEQNVRNTLETADRAYVLENGRISLEGACDELLHSDHIRKAYLGL